MAEMMRHTPDWVLRGSGRSDLRCPDCGGNRQFEQHHGAAGRCPDTPDRCCPEWYCLACGAALLIGAVPAVADAVALAAVAGHTAEIRDRVA
jgi:hypothetical protein